MTMESENKIIHIERLVPGRAPSNLWEEHLTRYQFATKYAENKFVLDLGCGTGYGSFELAKNRKVKKIIGIDNSKEAIDYAKKHYQNRNLEFRIGDVSNLDFPDGSADIIIAFEIIEHLKEPDKFLEEIKRVLKKSGLCLISTPNRKIVSYPCLKYRGPRNIYHEFELIENEFLNLLKGHFKIVDFYGQRLIPRILTPCLIRKLVEKFSYHLAPIIKKDLNWRIYYQANGPALIRLPQKGKTTVGFLAVCQK